MLFRINFSVCSNAIGGAIAMRYLKRFAVNQCNVVLLLFFVCVVKFVASVDAFIYLRDLKLTVIQM